jgi:hypothetical protein
LTPLSLSLTPPTGNQFANAIAQGEANDHGNYNLHHRDTMASDAYTDLNSLPCG